MSWGKGQAPCGHAGEIVVGTFCLCLEGCDGPPKVCSRCGARKMRPFVGFNAPPGSWHCLACGRVVWRPG